MRGQILPPLTASVHVKPAGWRFGLRLWLPLFLLWFILLLLFLLALPFLLVAALIFGFNLLRALGAGFAVLTGLRGCRVDVNTPDTRVFIELQ